MGTLAAYVTHFLLESGVILVVAISLSILVVSVSTLLLHRYLFKRFVDADRPLLGLLAGIAVMQIIESSAALYGRGGSQQIRSGADVSLLHIGGATVSGNHIAIAAIILMVSVFLALMWKGRIGAMVRATLSSPDSAFQIGISAPKIDKAILVFSSAILGLSVVLWSAQFDLQPNMMFFPGMVLIASCLIAGPTNWVLAPLVTMVLMVLSTIVSAFPATSEFGRALPLILAVVTLMIRAFRAPNS